MLKKFFNNIINWFRSEKYEPVFQYSGTWDVKYTDTGRVVNEHCHFVILKSNKGNYKLDATGYKPKHHGLYPEVFKYYRGLAEGIYVVKGGEIFIKEKDELDLTLEECNQKLQQAIADENYELAERLRKIIESKK